MSIFKNIKDYSKVLSNKNNQENEKALVNIYNRSHKTSHEKIPGFFTPFENSLEAKKTRTNDLIISIGTSSVMSVKWLFLANCGLLSSCYNFFTFKPLSMAKNLAVTALCLATSLLYLLTVFIMPELLLCQWATRSFITHANEHQSKNNVFANKI